MTPYFSVCGPPEFVATLPPIVQAPGSTGRGVVIAGPLERVGEPDIDHARLHHGVAVAEIDLQDLLHPREHDHHAAADRQAAAGQAGAGPARQERHVVSVAEPHDLGDLLGRARKDHHVGAVLLDHEAVALVDDQVRREERTPSAPTRSRNRSRARVEAWSHRKG